MTTYNDLFRPAADDFQVGDGATLLRWTDRTSYTVIARTAATVTLQADRVTFDYQTGQAVSITPDPEGGVMVARRSTRRGVTGWRCQGQTVVAGRHPYRDPHF